MAKAKNYLWDGLFFRSLADIVAPAVQEVCHWLHELEECLGIFPNSMLLLKPKTRNAALATACRRGWCCSRVPLPNSLPWPERGLRWFTALSCLYLPIAGYWGRELLGGPSRSASTPFAQAGANEPW